MRLYATIVKFSFGLAVSIACLGSAYAQQTQSVTFSFVAASKGDKVEQTTTTRSNLHTTYEQSSQVISSDTKDETIKQNRLIEVVETAASGIPTVKVKYAKATKKTNGSLLARSKPQPVAGKSYIVQRRGDELDITYPDGSAPTAAELGIVRVNMQSVGKENPLAKFLDGKTISLGQVLRLPDQVGQELMGSWLGKDALPVTIKMTKLHQHQTKLTNQPAATFEIQMTSRNVDGLPSVSSAGQVTVGVLNCQTLQLRMNADVNLTEKRGPQGATFTVKNHGNVHIEMAANYADAQSFQR